MFEVLQCLWIEPLSCHSYFSAESVRSLREGLSTGAEQRGPVPGSALPGKRGRNDLLCRGPEVSWQGLWWAHQHQPKPIRTHWSCKSCSTLLQCHTTLFNHLPLKQQNSFHSSFSRVSTGRSRDTHFHRQSGVQSGTVDHDTQHASTRRGVHLQVMNNKHDCDNWYFSERLLLHIPLNLASIQRRFSYYINDFPVVRGDIVLQFILLLFLKDNNLSLWWHLKTAFCFRLLCQYIW